MKFNVLETTVTAGVEVNGSEFQIKYNDRGLVECNRDIYLEVYESLINQMVVKEPEIVNLTSHDVTLVNEYGQTRVFPPSGTVARVNQTLVDFNISGIPVKRIQDIRLAGLPPEEPGKIFIVSGRVFEASTRPDLIAPDTTPDSVVKDGNGSIIGVRQFFTKI